MQLIPYLLIFLMGIHIGSFLNVCIYRIPLGKTIVKGRSYCPKCDKLIPFYYNIPILSYLFLRGKCAYCKTAISPIYPGVEMLTGLLWLLVFYIQGFTVEALFGVALLSLLLTLTFIDLKHRIIPDGLVIAILVLALGHVLYQVAYQGMAWQSYALGFFAASLPLYLLAMVYPDGLGGGDIKLMAAAGLFIGWQKILLGLFLGNLVAFAYIIILFFQKKAKKGTAIAFGPFLSLGIVLALLFGQTILTWYLTVFF